jgi:hypothetical protein
MTRSYFVLLAKDSLIFAQARARNFKINETTIQLWSHFAKANNSTLKGATK